MELRSFLHSWILCCGSSWNPEMCRMGTSYQASRFLPPLSTTDPHLSQEGAEPLFSPSQKEPRPQRLTAFMTAWVTASRAVGHFWEDCCEGDSQDPQEAPILCQQEVQLFGNCDATGVHTCREQPGWQPRRLPGVFARHGEKGGSWVSAGLTAPTGVPLHLRWFPCSGQRPHSHSVDAHPVGYGPDGQRSVQGFMNLALQGGCVACW